MKREAWNNQAPFSLLQDVTIYYFYLWAAQNLDLSLAFLLHLFPSLVFAAHLTFFAFAIFSPFFRQLGRLTSL